MRRAPDPQLTSEIIRQVRRIQIRTGRPVADALAGAYTSVFRGRGMEFEEVRPYVPGDDVRTIDWNVTARTGVPHVKRFVEERELTVMLLVDVSPSQEFGSKERTKREAAAELSALVAFSAIHNNDKVGLLLFSGGTELYIPPRKGKSHALRIVREVIAQGYAGSEPEAPAPVKSKLARLRELFSRRTSAPKDRKTNISAAIEHCRKSLKRRAILFVVSDFLDDGYLLPLRSASSRHDVIAVHVTDRREIQTVPAGLIALEDAESGEVRLIDTSSKAFREHAEKEATKRVEAIRKSLTSGRIDLIAVDAAGSVVDPLLAFFRRRQRRFRS